MKRSLSILFCAIVASLLQVTVLAQAPSRDELLKQIETRRTELQKLEDQFLTPSAEDRAAYAEFLQQPDTGLIRLLPREIYDSETYKKNNRTLTLRGGGAYYSFTRLTHEYGYGSDIELDSGYLSVGFAGAAYGLMTTNDAVPLEEMSLDHPAARFLVAYQPPAAEAEAREEARSFGTAGRIIDGFNYQSRVPVKLNTTYLLRSIDYERSDVLVAFRVVRKDTDGSVIFVWRLLKKYPKPELARNK